MNYQEAIKVLDEYYELCKLHNLKFEWSLEGLKNNPGNIKLAVIRRKIKTIRDAYPLQKKAAKVIKRKKINKPISKNKKESKQPKREIHGTTAKLKRSEVEAGSKKRKGSKKRNSRKKKK